MCIRNIVESLVRSAGPCSFNTILRYADAQHVGQVASHEVAAALTSLIRDGVVELYDIDGAFCVSERGDAMRLAQRSQS